MGPLESNMTKDLSFFFVYTKNALSADTARNNTPSKESRHIVNTGDVQVADVLFVSERKSCNELTSIPCGIPGK